MKKIARFILSALLVFSFVVAQPLYAADGGGGSGSGGSGSNDVGGGSGQQAGMDKGSSAGVQNGTDAANNANSTSDKGFFGDVADLIGSFVSGFIDVASAVAPGGFAAQGISIGMTGQSLGASVTGYDTSLGRGISSFGSSVIDGIGSALGISSGGGSSSSSGGVGANGGSDSPGSGALGNSDTSGTGVGNDNGSYRDSTHTLQVDGTLLVLHVDKEQVGKGQSVVVSWQGSNLTACKASGDYWSGDKVQQGSEEIKNLQANQVFTLTCDSASGKRTKTVFVQVAGADASYDTALNAGLGAQNYLDTATRPTGLADRSRLPKSNTVGGNTSQNHLVTQSPGSNGSGINPGLDSGSGSRVDTRSIIDTKPTVNLTVDTNSVPLGGSVVLSWKSKNAIYCVSANDFATHQGPLSNGTYKPTFGSERVSYINTDKTLTLVCYNDVGDSSSNSVRVTVGATVVSDIKNFTASPMVGDAPLQVTFTGEAGSSYDIDFGDGTSFKSAVCMGGCSTTNIQTSHRYTVGGTYTARLTSYGSPNPPYYTYKTLTITAQ